MLTFPYHLKRHLLQYAIGCDCFVLLLLCRNYVIEADSFLGVILLRYYLPGKGIHLWVVGLLLNGVLIKLVLSLCPYSVYLYLPCTPLFWTKLPRYICSLLAKFILFGEVILQFIQILLVVIELGRLQKEIVQDLLLYARYKI